MDYTPALSPALTLYVTRNGNYTAAVIPNRESGPGAPEIFDINGTGKDVLALVDGTRSVEQIAYRLRADHGLDASVNMDWVEEFLEDMTRRKAIVPATPGMKSDLTIVGDGERLWPAQVTIEVTATCNLRCQHCYLDASPEKRTRISIEDFRRLVSDLVRHHVLTVELTGGEFFMHPEALEILELAYAHFAKVGILTNGTHIPDRAVDMLAANSDRTVVGVSLDSAQAELHDRWRGGRGAFARTCANVRRLSERGVVVRIGATIFEENRWELEDLAKLAVSLGARLFAFGFVEDSGRGGNRQDDQKLRFDSDYEAYLARVISTYKDIIPIVRIDDTQTAHRNCGAGSKAMTIGADGSMRPCTLFPRALIMGNALRGGWNGVADLALPNRLAEIPAPSLENGCDSSCPLLMRCRGCYLKGLRANVGRPASEYCSWVARHDLGDLVEASSLPRTGPIPVKLARR